MASPLIDWPRPYFRSGHGDPFLFYVVYGEMPQELTISRSKYRCDGIPDGMTLMRYGPSVHSEVVDSFREGYVWQQFSRNRPALAADVQRQTECIVIVGSVADRADLNYFRDIVGLITWGFDGGGVALYDPQTFTWWDSGEWRSRVFEPATASPREHVAILVSEDEEGTEWLHTRGMRKFGRPDLSVHHVAPDQKNAVVDLCNRFIEFQALGGVIAEREEIKMRALPAGMVCRHRGDPDDPDFNNVHVEVTWPA